MQFCSSWFTQTVHRSRRIYFLLKHRNPVKTLLTCPEQAPTPRKTLLTCPEQAPTPRNTLLTCPEQAPLNAPQSSCKPHHNNTPSLKFHRVFLKAFLFIFLFILGTSENIPNNAVLFP
jgi:hypothetical protein